MYFQFQYDRSALPLLLGLKNSSKHHGLSTGLPQHQKQSLSSGRRWRGRYAQDYAFASDQCTYFNDIAKAE